jgi:AcrR family transcriptional regulator
VARAGLTRHRVTAEAASLSDEVGLERVTLAAVAQRLGVSGPALYKHVEGLDGLQRDLAVLALRELTERLSAVTVGRARGDALRALADAYRSYATAHPGRAAAAVRAPAPDDAEHADAAEAAVGILAAILSGYDITGSDAVDAIRTLRAAMHGFTTLESSGGFGLPESVDATYARMIDTLDAGFASWARR